MSDSSILWINFNGGASSANTAAYGALPARITIATIPKWYQRINSSSILKLRRIKMIRQRNDSMRLSLQNPGIQHRGHGEKPQRVRRGCWRRTEIDG